MPHLPVTTFEIALLTVLLSAFSLCFLDAVMATGKQGDIAGKHCNIPSQPVSVQPRNKCFALNSRYLSWPELRVGVGQSTSGFYLPKKSHLNFKVL